MNKDKFIVVEIGNLPLIIYKGKRGYIATLHLCKESVEKIGDAAAFVGGVKSIDDFLSTKVRKVTKWAEDLGLREGMTVKRVIRILDGEED